MNLETLVSLVDEAETKFQAAYTALNEAFEQVSVAQEATTQRINRLVLARGQVSVISLDRSIGDCESALVELDRVSAKIQEIQQILEASNEKSHFFWEKIHE